MAEQETDPLLDHSVLKENNCRINDTSKLDAKIRLPSVNLKCLHPILLPLEVCTFLFLFIIYFQVQVYQQYYYQRIMKEQIKSYTNYSDNTTENICLTEDIIVNLTDNETFIEGQRKVNNISMITALASLLPSLLTSLFLTPLSDHYGRKPILAMVFLGQTVGSLIVAFIVQFQLSMYIFLASSSITGLFGGFGVLLACSFAYVTDMTPKRWLTIRMGILEVSIFVATATASAVADKWMDKVDCDFRLMAWLIAMLAAGGFLYSLIIPESVTEQVKLANKGSSQRGLKTFIRGAKIAFLPRYIGYYKLWKLWIAILIVILAMICQTGKAEIMGYFLRNEPLKWTYSQIGNYLIVVSVSHIVGLVIFLPIFVILKVPNAVMILIGLLFSFGESIFVALLTTTLEMFLAGALAGMQAVIAPSLRSIIGRIVSKEDLGAAFSILAAFQLLGTVVGTVIFNELYAPGGSLSPKLVYWLSAGLWGAGILLILLLIIFPEKKANKQILTEECDNAQ